METGTNRVTPCPTRVTDEKGKVTHGPPAVDAPAIPELVARGVMPFVWLPFRADYPERFAGCDEPKHVHDVLLAEGYYERPTDPQWRAGHDKRARAARERVRKRKARNAGEA